MAKVSSAMSDYINSCRAMSGSVPAISGSVRAISGSVQAMSDQFESAGLLVVPFALSRLHWKKFTGFISNQKLIIIIV